MSAMIFAETTEVFLLPPVRRGLGEERKPSAVRKTRF